MLRKRKSGKHESREQETAESLKREAQIKKKERKARIKTQ